MHQNKNSGLIWIVWLRVFFHAFIYYYIFLCFSNLYITYTNIWIKIYKTYKFKKFFKYLKIHFFFDENLENTEKMWRRWNTTHNLNSRNFHFSLSVFLWMFHKQANWSDEPGCLVVFFFSSTSSIIRHFQWSKKLPKMF